MEKKVIMSLIAIGIACGTAAAQTDALRLNAAGIKKSLSEISVPSPKPQSIPQEGVITASPKVETATGGLAASLTLELAAAGAYVNCGAGKCGTAVSGLQCWTMSDPGGGRDYTCTMSAPNSTGNMTGMVVEPVKAKALFTATGNIAGAACSGDLNSCFTGAKEAACAYSAGALPHDYTCTITAYR